MKKYIGILLVITALLLGGCGKQTSEAAPAAASETSAPAPAELTPTEPESEPGKVLIPHLGAVLGTLPAGEQVTILSTEDEYYLADTSVGQGLIEKRLLCLSGEPKFESYTGYAKSGAELYKDYLMLTSGAPLAVNTELEVLQTFEGGFMVKLEDETGYVAAELLSKSPVATGGWGGGGSFGGSSGGSGGSSSGATDGGDISLTSAAVPNDRVRMLASSSFATVIVDDAEVYAAFLDRDEMVKVTEATDEVCTVYMDGNLLTVPRCFVALKGDAAFESYTAYANWSAVVYEEHTMTGDPVKELKVNEELTVLGDFGRCFLVELGDTIGFMKSDALSKAPVYIGGSSFGGGGGTTAVAENWTPPVL